MLKKAFSWLQLASIQPRSNPGKFADIIRARKPYARDRFRPYLEHAEMRQRRTAREAEIRDGGDALSGRYEYLSGDAVATNICPEIRSLRISLWRIAENIEEDRQTGTYSPEARRDCSGAFRISTVTRSFVRGTSSGTSRFRT